MNNRRTYLAVFVLLLLSACGFHLRGSGPSAMGQTLYVDGIAANDPFVSDLTDVLTVAGGRLASAVSEAGGVVHIYRARHTRRSLVLSRFGRSTAFDLNFRVVFDVRTAQGEILLPRQEIEITREYFNDQSLPLAQTAEEGVIRQEMQKEAAETLLRRVTYALKQGGKS